MAMNDDYDTDSNKHSNNNNKTHREIVEKYGVISSQRWQGCLPEPLHHSNSGATLCPPLHPIEYDRVRFHHGVGARGELLDFIG